MQTICISPTEYDVLRYDTANIVAVSANGLQLTLDRALTYSHAGHTFNVPAWGLKSSTSGNVTLAAAVGLLTRNIKYALLRGL